MEIVLGKGVVEAVDAQGQNIQSQFLGGGKGAAVEALDGAVFRTGSFRENDDGIALGHQLFYMCAVSGKAPGCREIAGFADDRTIEREFPYPVVGHEDEFGLEGNEG